MKKEKRNYKEEYENLEQKVIALELQIREKDKSILEQTQKLTQEVLKRDVIIEFLYGKLTTK